MPNVSRTAIGSDLGLPDPLDRVYRRVLPVTGRTIEDAAHGLFVTPEELREELAPLLELGIVRIGPRGAIHVDAPVEALARYVRARAADLSHCAVELGKVARAIPTLAAAGASLRSGGSSPLDGELTEPEDVPGLLADWVRESTGDISFLRADQWRLRSESEMARVMDRAVRDGRRVRAIYPVRALTEAPERLRARAAFGEQIRILPEVDTRLAIVGPHHALVPDPLGVGVARHVVLRQAVLIELLVRYFDQLWERASAVPDLERGQPRPDLRRLLLVQLARGAKDEQIARTLGISLRTVRRRIATLMVELGVDTRFQAGAEAVRRGWL
jgi:hypothetical protein